MNLADQNALQERSHNTHKVNTLEKQCDSAMTLPYFIDFIKHALEFGKVKIKLLEMTFKGKQSIFPHHQPLQKSIVCLMKSIK